MDITLPADLAQALDEQARRQGTTAEQLALESLRRQFSPPPAPVAPAALAGSLADFLADAIGVLQSSEHVPGGARLSEAPGTVFTAGLVQKRQQGDL